MINSHSTATVCPILGLVWFGLVMAQALVPALRRQRQVGLYEFETSLIYRASSRIAREWKRERRQK